MEGVKNSIAFGKALGRGGGETGGGGHTGRGGGVAVGNFRHGIFRSGFISHAVLDLPWEISHPHAVS